MWSAYTVTLSSPMSSQPFPCHDCEILDRRTMPKFGWNILEDNLHQFYGPDFFDRYPRKGNNIFLDFGEIK